MHKPLIFMPFLVLFALTGLGTHHRDKPLARVNDFIDQYVGHLKSTIDGNWLGKLVKTKKYRSLKGRIGKLNALKEEISNHEVSPGEVLLAITDDLAPYRDLEGARFFDQAKHTLLTMIKRMIKQSVATNGIKRPCLVCFEDYHTDFVVFNCGHANVCKNCSKRGHFNKCPTCRQRITHTSYLSICLLCGDNEATSLHSDCRHMDMCADCLTKRKGKSCLVCCDDHECKSLKLFY